MKSKRRLVPRVARRTAEVVDTAPAVQSSVAVLLTQHLKTKSSEKTLVGKAESGEFGVSLNCVIAAFHAGAGVCAPALVQLDVPHGPAGESDGAQPLEGPQPLEPRRMGCVERRMLQWMRGSQGYD
jgi:hypothetical protein